MAVTAASTRSARHSFSVGDTLRAAAPALPAALVNAAAQSHILALADDLPGTLTTFCGYECRLGSPEANADFLFCSTRPEGHARVLAGLDETDELPATLLALPAWQQVRAFARSWLHADSPLDGQIVNTWLEFDVDAADGAGRAPSVFFGTPELPSGTPAITQLPLVRAGLALLAPAAVADERDAALTRFFAALPDGARVFQVGVMLARPAAVVRLCVRGVPRGDLIDLLHALAWPGATTAVAELLGGVARSAERIDVDVDLGTAVGAKLGLECYFGSDLATGARLRAMLGALVEAGLCTADKADALVAYSGLDSQDRAANWPMHLRALAAEAGADITSCLLRWVHHVKLVLEAGQPTSAKAYLALEHHLLAREHLRAAIAAARTGLGT